MACVCSAVITKVASGISWPGTSKWIGIISISASSDHLDDGLVSCELYTQELAIRKN